MLEQVAKTIRERRLFPDGGRILVAVSGGVDSIVLLHLLNELAPVHGWKLIVAHFNHKLRGRESGGDERFVRSLAKSLNLAFVSGSANVKGRAQKTGQSIEMAARELRHSFFARVARSKSVKSIALAHNADDQVELFFLRLLRGASVEGLSGMKSRSPSPSDKTIDLVRPLLECSRRQIEQFARARKLRWREDTSNRSVDFLRNRIRHELIPLLEKNYQPALRKNVSRLMQLLAAEGEVVDDLTRSNVPFKNAPIAIQRRLLQQQLIAMGIAADFTTIESLRLNRGQVIQINPAIRVRRDGDGRIDVITTATSTFISSSQKVTLNGRRIETQFAGRNIRFELNTTRGSKLKPSHNTESFDADKVGASIVLRHWQPGDRFQPIGAKSARKLQDIFVNLKVPKEERHSLIIATTAGNEIFWVEGIRIADRFKLASGTKRRLVLRWECR